MRHFIVYLIRFHFKNIFRPTPGVLLGAGLGRQDPAGRDALPEGHGPRQPHPDLFRSDRQRKKDDAPGLYT